MQKSPVQTIKTIEKTKEELGKKGADDGKKRKKKFRGKKSKNANPNPARLPQNKASFSSNWEKLKSELPPPRKRARPSNFQDLKPVKKVKQAEQITQKNDIWFDDVDEELLDPEDRPDFVKSNQDEIKKSNASEGDGLVKEKGFKGLTKIIGIDCEMVGVGYTGEDSILARISLVNHFGHCVYDKYVKPREKVTDYRTAVSGIRPKDIQDGMPFKEVQKEVAEILDGRILVGHALKHDLKVLFLDHPKRMIRDTSTYKPFRNAFGGRTPSLKKLSERMLGVTVQEGEHSSVQDAQAAVRLYTMFRREWERSLDQHKKREVFEKSKKAQQISKHVNIKMKLSSKKSSKDRFKATVRPTNCPKYQDSDSE